MLGTSATAGKVPFRLTLAVLSGDAPLPQLESELRGRVRIPVRLETLSLDFGDSLVRGAPYPTMRTVGTSVEDVSTLYVAERPGYLQAMIDKTRSGWTVSVQPLQETPESFATVVWLAGRLATGERFSGLPLQVNGRVVDDIRSTPEAITFAPLKVGVTATDYVVLSSRSNKRFRITDVRTDDGITVTPHDSDLHSYSIAITVDRPGHHNRSVWFSVTTDSAEQATLVLPVTVFGLRTRSEPPHMRQQT
jgi:hypothetical protein